MYSTSYFYFSRQECEKVSSYGHVYECSCLCTICKSYEYSCLCVQGTSGVKNVQDCHSYRLHSSQPAEINNFHTYLHIYYIILFTL